MKKSFLLLVSSFLLSMSSAFAADITIGTPGGAGGVEVNGIWAKGSNVIINDHVIIPVGGSLTIEEGVNVQIADTTLKIEFIVLGNFYAKGTKENPISISVKSDMVPANVPSARPFPGFWGSILCDTTCSEFLMLYTNIKYYGAATSDNSPSVLLHLYKNASGETEPYINFRNHNNGKLVIEHCTFSNGMDDGIYIEGGNVIYAYNVLYQNGYTGGDATNFKAGSIADCAFNFYYSPNTNAFKLSNSGSRSPQANILVYNNTIVNAGWRRPTVKGGGIWYEAAVVAKSFNNLQINNRFGIKSDGKADAASDADYNYYYGYGQNVVNNFTSVKGLFKQGAHDILGASAGDKDPLLVNYPLNTDTMNSAYDQSWDFRLQANSPAVGKGTNSFVRHFGTTGITIGGVEYKSPEPSTTIGAFGQVIAVTGITISDKTASLKVGETKTLSASVAPDNADVLTYSFGSIDASIATVDQNGVVTGVKEGTTKIYATTAGFGDTCVVTVTAATAIINVNKDNFSVYPNPVKSELFVQFGNTSKQSTILVYSVLGEVVMLKNINGSSDNNTVSLSVENLKDGLYFISLQNAGQKITKSFVKK